MGMRRGVREFETPESGAMVESTIEKFEPGVEVAAIYKAMRTGNFGPLVDLEYPEEGVTVTFGVPAILESRLQRVARGSKVLIQCIGREKAKKAGFNDTLLFQVFVLAAPDGGAAKSEALPF